MNFPRLLMDCELVASILEIEELNRQDAKLAERGKGEENSRIWLSPLIYFLLCVFLATLGVLAVQFPAFFLGLTTTLESIMSLT